MEMILKKIPIDKIHVPIIQHRRVDKDGEQFKGMVKSIKEWGQKQPVSVQEGKENPDGLPYTLCFGFHRLAACRELGHKSIMTVIEDPKMTDPNVQLLQLQENLARVTPKPRETADHLLRIIESDEYLGVDLATILAKLSINLKPAQVNGLLKLTHLNEDIGQMVDQGRIKVNNARALATIPADRQSDYAKYAQQMPFNDFKPFIVDELEKIRVSSGKTPKPVNRWQGSKFQKLKDIQSLIIEVENKKNPFQKDFPKELVDSAQYKENENLVKEGILIALQWTVHMDPKNVKIREAKNAQTQAERDAKKQINNSVVAKIRKLQQDPEKSAELNELLNSLV